MPPQKQLSIPDETYLKLEHIASPTAHDSHIKCSEWVLPNQT